MMPGKQLIALASAGLCLIGQVSAREKSAQPGKHVVFLAGEDSHGWGAHKHIAGSTLLSEALPEGAPQVTTQMIRTWPDAETLKNADALVIYADGWNRHPANGHLDELKAFMDSGKGLVAIHWATGIGVAPRSSGPQQERPERIAWRQLLGADFEPFYSISNFYTADFEKPSGHPVMNGVPPFKLHDECYFHLRESEAGNGKLEAVLPVHPPAQTIQKGRSPFRGNDVARAALEKKEEQYCAWTYERSNGGRAFGFTGGHFHWNWARDEVRKMVLNGILWSAGGKVPEQGVNTPTPSASQMLANMKTANPGWTEDALQAALDLAQSGTPVEWGKHSNGPLELVAAPQTVSLFDGKSLDGWTSTKGVWRIEDGAITAGSHEKKFPRNEFISTEKSYSNFELKLKIKCTGDPKTGLINSGIQIRSARLENGRMAGYQVDCGDKWFGKIYDEHRRALIYPKPIDEAALMKGIDVFGWNEYRILADGPRIQVWINGIKASDYTETNPLIPLDGLIAPQIHSGGKVMVQFKDVSIRELPQTPGAPTWESLGGVTEALKKVKKPRKPAARKKAKPAPPANKPDKDTSQNENENGALPASEQLKRFKLAEGYEIELVAQESDGIGKFVSVYFDQRGRMWTQTALEYPVDGNENPAAAKALYERQGKDKVLVYPRESLASIPAEGLTQPTVFADGLAIPLGLLPWGDGDSAYVLHGPDLLLLTDTDQDGRADRREVILTGLGVQDSHLLPHQFTRAPGDWIWMAQGLFNNSAVKQPGGKDSIKWPKCSMARMRPDGSEFEVTSTGPNNIWGLVLTGEGKTFIQEANDYGYPTMPFHEYAYYPGGMKAFRKSYQPSFPPTADFRMGGTGLSGLALLENGPLQNKQADINMLVANPITSKVQTLGMQRDGAYWSLDQLADLVTCDDPFFRPVAMTQGPDGHLYIVDWYNKIISHNEVPRNHPERDKTRGRIWRVKAISNTEPSGIPDFTALGSPELVDMLGKEPTARAHLAWQTLADRNDPKVVETLEAELKGGNTSDARAIQSLWVLGEKATEVGGELVSSQSANVRHELARHPRFAAGLIEDPDREVRFAAITTLGRQLDEDTDERLHQLLASVKPAIQGAETKDSRTGQPIPVREAYDREFERFLIRFFLERHPHQLSTFLDSERADDLPLEARILASLALPPAQSARRIAKLLPQLDRSPNAEELFRIAEFPNAPGCSEALAALLSKKESQAMVAEQLLTQKTRLDPAKIAPLLTTAARSLLAGDESSRLIGLELAGAYALTDLEPDILAVLGKPSASTAERLATLTTLRQLRTGEIQTFIRLVTSEEEDAAIREAALGVLTASRAPEAATRLLELYPDLDLTRRKLVLKGLSSSKHGARTLVAALKSGRLAADDIDAANAERLAAVLANDPSLSDLESALGHIFGEVLTLNGKPTADADPDITLTGPFTVESWIRLAPGIDQKDSLLGAKGAADFNFYNSTLHLWTGSGVGNVAVANQPMAPDLWTHVAVTRNAEGEFRIYLDGELDGVGRKKSTADFPGLKIGSSTHPRGGTQASFAEYRIWNRERSAAEIRQNFDRSFDSAPTPEGLVFQGSGKKWGKLGAGAAIVKTTELPPLLTLEEAAALDAKFDKYMKLGRNGGDPGKGKLLSALCTSCHVIDGQGGQIGPELSGASEMGLEAVLRNILTPNAAMESGYRIFRVEMKSGEIIDAFFVSEDKKAVVIREIGLPDRRIPRSEIASTTFIRRSLMPEGLLDALSDEQAADLLAYLLNDDKADAPKGQ